MPTVSLFYGIAIRMYSDEGLHARGHFHAIYGEYIASISFDGEVLAGALPDRQLRMVRRWASLHISELRDNWELARDGQPVRQIEPLT